MHGAKWWSSRAHALKADRHRVLAIYLEYNKLVVPEFSFNLNGNLRNDARRKLGPAFLGHPVPEIFSVCHT